MNIQLRTLSGRQIWKLATLAYIIMISWMFPGPILGNNYSITGSERFCDLETVLHFRDDQQIVLANPFEEIIAARDATSWMSAQELVLAAGDPCNAVRWTDGERWTGIECGVTSSGTPKGIVACGNAASTQSNIPPNTVYVPTNFTITGLTSCKDPDDLTPVMVLPPFTGQKIAWFNFDVRPSAGTYQFQTIATGSFELNWALYASTTPTCSVSGPSNLSGNCLALTATPIACGVDFNGWSAQPFIAPNFTQPTNLYMVVWRREATNSQNDDFKFNFKARYGCGDFCSLFLNGSPIITCNANGSYTLKQSIHGTSTTVTVSAPGSTSVVTSPSPLTFTSADAMPNVNSGMVTVTYPAGVNYNITLTPSGSGFYCNPINISGASCCIPPVCSITGANTICPSSQGNTYSGPVASAYSWSISGNGTIPGSTTGQSVSVLAGSGCNNALTLSLTVTDVNGCTSQCTKTVSVVDNTAPMLICPAGSNLGCNPADSDMDGIPNGVATSVGWTDNCDGSGTTNSYLDLSSVLTGCARSVTRRFSYTDACGNTGTCSIAYTWRVDSTPPVLTCPSTGLDLGCNPPDTNTDGIPDGVATSVSWTDNCDGSGSTTVFSDLVSTLTGCNRTVTRRFSYTDGCGLTGTCEVIYTWRVDTQSPVLTCPSTGLDLGCNPMDTDMDGIPDGLAAEVSWTDNCDGSGTTNTFSDINSVLNGCERSLTRRFGHTDLCNNTGICDVIYTWRVDTQDPVLACPTSGLELGCNPVDADMDGIPDGVTTTVPWTDNCEGNGSTTAFIDIASVLTGCDRSVTRRFSKTDACNNTGTCDVSYTWTLDTVAPIISCPQEMDLGCNPADADMDGIPDIIATTVSWTDNCNGSGSTSSYTDIASVLTGCNRSITRRFSYSDACNNIGTCDTEYAWRIDTNAPVLVCPGSQDLGCNPQDADMDGIPDAVITAVSWTDNCDGSGVTTLYSDIVTMPEGCNRSLTRRFMYTDNCMNSGMCEAEYTWTVDHDPPAIACAGVDDLVIECVAGLDYVAIIEDWIASGKASILANPGISDECDPNVSIDDDYDGVSVPLVGCNYSGGLIVTFLVTDDCNNTALCTKHVIIIDVTPPLITCPAGIVLQCYGEIPEPDVFQVDANDACDISVVVEYVGETSDGNQCPEIIIRTYRAVDQCGNSTICTEQITIHDTTPPVVVCPDPITVECHEDVPPADLASLSLSDNCNGDVDVTFVSDVSDGSQCPEVITRSYRATDACGNESICTQHITIYDTTPPMIECLVPVTIDCLEDVPPVDPGVLSTSDNCSGNIEVTFVSDVSDGNQCPELIIRTYLATDGCGNSAVCTQRITIHDLTPPTIECPASVTVECREDIPSVDLASLSASDNCIGDVDVTFVGDVSDGNQCPERITRTYRATDVCGNVALCTQYISIYDITPPAAICPDPVVVACSEDIPAPEEASVTVIDNCIGDIVVAHLQDVSNGNTCPEVIMRTYRITDACGNFVTCQQMITVNDITPPEITCPAQLTVQSIGEIPQPDITLVSASDNCTGDIFVTFVSDISDQGTCDQLVLRTYRATDACGNTATCRQLIIVDDTTPPQITCPEHIEVQCSEDIPQPNIALIIAHDNCAEEVAVMLVSDSSNGGTCPEIITRTYRATDVHGNTSICTHYITVHDTTEPEITCPDDIVVECIEDVPAHDISLVITHDNCDAGVIVTFVSDISDGNTCPEVITRTYRATDACGNTVTCKQLIMVDDTTDPEITCLYDIVVECIEEVPAHDISLVITHDNCDAGVIVTFVSDVSDGNICPEVITRTYRATDACGNTVTCKQLIAVDDTTDPEITCPDDIVVECIEDVPAHDISLVITHDNCDAGVIVTFVSDVSDGNTCPEVIIRTYRATDACGNTVTCKQLITVDDTTDPEITCPDDIVVECIEDVPAHDISLVITHDNCDVGVIVTFVSDVSDGNTCPEVITRTYRSTDTCGNSVTCKQLITVDDTTDPEITCPDDIVVECIEDVPAHDISLVSTHDNCDAGVIVTFVSDISDGKTCPGVITRTYRATDACGNTVTCKQLITVDDTTPPSITCPPDATYQCLQDVPPLNVDDVIATDNCGSPEVEPILVSSEGPCPTVIERIFMATDACGNTAICMQTITVDDTTPPEINCPPDMTFECIGDVPPVDILAVTAFDNCTVPSVAFVNETTVGICPTVISRVYMATDACQNVSFCTQTFVIHDQTPPELVCPADMTIQCGSVSPPPGTAIVSDNCDTDAMVIDIIESEPQGTCPRVILRTFYASDACGNVSSCTQRIYLEDNSGPLIHCPEDITIECGTAIPVTVAAVSDCSGVQSVTYSDTQPLGGDCSMTIARTFTAIDYCGNSSICVQQITIEDTSPPVLICEDLNVECAEKTCLTFDNIVVNPYAPPVIITNVVAGGITVNVKAYRKGGVQVSAALFNTTTPHPNDLDLGTPNKLYGGAGVNHEHANGYNPSNNRPAGKAIIIQTPGSPVADDYLLSDSLVFTFSKPVFLESLLAVDFEIHQINTGAKIFMYDDTGALLGTSLFNTPPGEDNNLEDILLETPAVKKLKIYFGRAIPASGGIARICYVNIPEATAIDCNPTQVTFTKTSSEPDECTTEIVRVYSAVDACGNATIDGCTQRITINTDVERPEIICPADITIGCNDPLPPVNTNDVVVTDNCNLPGTTVEWLFDLVDGTGCNRVTRRIYRAIGGCGNIARCVQYIHRAPKIELTSNVILGGAYMPSPDTMRTSINSLLPHTQPYSGVRYNYFGSESVATFPANVVDWVLVEVRSSADQNVVVARRAALLTKSGSVVDLNGVSPVSFFAPLTQYYVSVRHRNHLDIISNNTVNFASGSASVNFTAAGVSSGTVLNPISGKYVMSKGDVNGDHQVKYNGSNNDRNAILSAVGTLTPNNVLTNVYHNADVNLDGSVKYNGSANDKNEVLNTVGLTTPNNIVVGQFF